MLAFLKKLMPTTKKALTSRGNMDEAGNPGRRAEDFKVKVNWIIPLLGLIAVLLAVILEYAVLPGHYVNGKPGNIVVSLKTVIGLLKEIGFAAIIAFGVAYLIDAHAKRSEHQAHVAARKQITSDVFHAVFGLQYDVNYVKTVIETTLKAKVIRKRYAVNYSLEKLTPREAGLLGVDINRFVKLTQISSYTFQNVTPSSVKHVIGYSMPSRSGAFYDFARLMRARIAGEQKSEDDISAALVPGDRNNDVMKTYRWTVDIDPRKEVEVVMEAVNIKELSDAEVWGNAHATYEGMTMTVRNNVTNIVRFGINTHTATDPVTLYHNKAEAHFQIDGPILPNNSVTFWWRSAEDDGRRPFGVGASVAVATAEETPTRSAELARTPEPNPPQPETETQSAAKPK